jgi:hypothetical protein
MSARQPRPPREQEVAERRLDGLRPLLQGHLRKQRKGTVPAVQDPPVEAEPPSRAIVPAIEPAAKGKRARGKAETATREHLEGAEQGPM